MKIADRWEAYLASPPPEKEHKGVGLLYIPDVLGIWQVGEPDLEDSLPQIEAS